MIKKIGLALLAASFAAGVQAVDFVDGFESGLVGWNVIASGNNKVSVENVNDLESMVYTTHDGPPNVNVVTFYGISSLSYKLSTVANQDYKLSFWLLHTGDNELGTFFANVDGVEKFKQVDGFARNSTNAEGFLIHDAWRFYSDISFKATSELTTIELGSGGDPVTGVGVNEFYFFGLDDVSVTAVTAVPEPGTLGMMLFGLASLGVLSRRQKRAQR